MGSAVPARYGEGRGGAERGKSDHIPRGLSAISLLPRRLDAARRREGAGAGLASRRDVIQVAAADSPVDCSKLPRYTPRHISHSIQSMRMRDMCRLTVRLDPTSRCTILSSIPCEHIILELMGYLRVIYFNR